MEGISKFQEWFKQNSRVSINKKQRKELQETRRNNRNTILMQKRGIMDDIVSSPELTREPVIKNPRLIALKEWQEKRNKEKLKQQANKKPVFKVQHISIDIGGPKLEFINKTIKGKRFDIKPKKTKKVAETVMGFEVNAIKQNDGITSRLRSKTNSSKVQNNLESTNTQKTTSSNVESKQKTQNVPEKKPNVKNSNKKKPLLESNEYSTPVKENSVQSSSYYTSPVQQKLAAAYVSPFVTITRGKSSARKEYKIRRSQGGLFDVSDQLAKATGHQAGAAHFHQLLNTEIERIEKMCDEWIKYKDDTNPPEEACDMINTTIGQSKLLINKRFQKFRALIINCETNNSVKPITCTDLHGYWEAVCLQIDDVNQRFENLNKLCANNWEEILPVVNKPKPKKRAVKKAPKKTVQTQSSLRELIKAKRLKFKEEAQTDENVPPSSTTRITRSSLLVAFKNNVNSPDIAFNKKRRVTISTDSTPAKGILKTPNAKSSKKKKLVLFRSDAIDMESPPIQIFKSRRSSRRLSKMLQE